MVRFVQQSIRRMFGKILEKIMTEVNLFFWQGLNQQVMQRQLFIYYQDLCKNRKNLCSFRDAGFRIYSQVDEDGILL